MVVSAETPPVAIIMGSRSDWPTLQAAAEVLDALGVAHADKVVSAHRTPQRLYAFATSAQATGYKVIIAGAGGAAHLPGMTASMTDLPVLGVPVESKALSGLDSLLSIVQMPGGVPVGTLAIGKAGALAKYRPKTDEDDNTTIEKVFLDGDEEVFPDETYAEL
jgi:5-(carboxyamino)imidazole ribonucleotide mutase